MLRRHPSYINYGNSQVVDIDADVDASGTGGEGEAGEETTSNSDSDSRSGIHRDYRYRRMYKIDWKVCFLKWISANQYKPDYHVFVEDDSFVCTENLLHQMGLLRLEKIRLAAVAAASANMGTSAHAAATSRLPNLRTGTPMYEYMC